MTSCVFLELPGVCSGYQVSATYAHVQYRSVSVENDCSGWSGGLGPAEMVGSFDVRPGAIAFHDARVGAVATCRVQPVE